MKKPNYFSRFSNSAITPKRLFNAINARIQEIPHNLTWQCSGQSRENRNRLEKFRNIHSGERCFIIANGPSLLQTNLDMLKNETSFGLNRIYLRFDSVQFRPTYYVATNELVITQFFQEIAQLVMLKFVNWSKRSLFYAGDESIAFLKTRFAIQDRFSTDLTKPLVFGGTVTFAALQIAYYMGFREVIIVGLDHSYRETGIPNSKEIRSSVEDQSHFHPQYFPKGVSWQLPDLRRSEIDFAIARTAFEADGREIYDATINGLCPVFKKVSYDDFF